MAPAAAPAKAAPAAAPAKATPAPAPVKAAVAPSPVHFKDFSKDASDLLKKNYTAIGDWKLESKFKGPDSELYINPHVEKDQLKVDLEYNVKSYGLKTKVSVSKKAVEPTITYEQSGHKVEAALAKRELTYEYKSGPFSLYDKVNQKEASIALAWQCCKEAAIGGSTSYDLQNSTIQTWSAGFLYSQNGRQVAISTESAQKFFTGILVPVPNPYVKNVKAVVTADCSRKGDAAKIGLGAEFTCPFTGMTMRLKVDSSKLVSLSALKKFADNWKAAVTVDSTFKGVGVQISRE